MYLNIFFINFLLILCVFASNDDVNLTSECDDHPSELASLNTSSVISAQRSVKTIEACDFSENNPDRKPFALAGVVPHYQRSSLYTKDSRKIFKIAVIGGGGAGTIIAALLSNLSKHSSLIGFEMTIFERNDNLINGSTFETAAVLHAGGREYPTDSETAASCQMTGELFQKMFPDLYSTPDSPIMFAVNSNSSLTPECQKETHQRAKRIKTSLLDASAASQGVDSQSEIPIEIAQNIFGDNIRGGILSQRDRPMKIFERNALLKKYIVNDKNIIVKLNHSVSSIIKNSDNKFEILIEDRLSDSVTYDHIILTAWDQNQIILSSSSSQDNANATNVQEFITEDRIMALCTINRIPPLQKTPIFVMTGGAMFLPLDDEIGIVYACKEGASYPRAGEREILFENRLQHGQEIIDEIKSILKQEGDRKKPFEHLELLGVRQQKIVIKRHIPLEKRHYEPPTVTAQGIIVALPPKAIFISALALQTIEHLLSQLPDSYSEFVGEWQGKIRTIIPDNTCLYTRNPLPEAFTIRAKNRISTYDIINEALLYISGCHLNEKGRDIQKAYANKRDSLLPSTFLLKRHQTTVLPTQSKNSQRKLFLKKSSGGAFSETSAVSIDSDNCSAENTNEVRTPMKDRSFALYQKSHSYPSEQHNTQNSFLISLKVSEDKRKLKRTNGEM